MERGAKASTKKMPGVQNFLKIFSCDGYEFFLKNKTGAFMWEICIVKNKIKSNKRLH